jgi:hypothetical protein
VSSFNIGLRYLTGCTAVVIIGNGGVYAAHFFEDQAMDLGLKATYAPTLLHYGGKNFETISSHIGELNSSPHGAPDAFPEVFIITPVKSAELPRDPGSKEPEDTRPALQIGYVPGVREYDQAYLDIYRAIQHYWPTINTIREVQYYPLNKANAAPAHMPAGNTYPPDSERLRKGAEGRVYFEYDKDRSVPNAEIRLWVETTRQIETTLA